MKTKPQPKTQAAPAAPMPGTVIFPTITARQADGSLSVKTGKPLSWLTPAQFATFFGVARSSVYRWKDDGTIPQEFIKPNGKRKIGINAAAVMVVQDALRQQRDFGPVVKTTDKQQVLKTV